MNVYENTIIHNEKNEEIIINKSNYNYEFKINLKNKIEKIKKKSNLVKIFMIINEDYETNTEENNEEKRYIENNNGIFMYINDLKNSTYKKLDIYVNSLTID
jgi:hypothetical protein